MIVALIVVSVALAICLGLLLLGPRGGPTVSSPAVQGHEQRLHKLEGDLDKKRKEAEDLKRSLQEMKEELKQTKRKLFEQRQEDKADGDLVKARAEVERQASTQLEIVRSELGAALAEINRLKTEGEGKGRRPMSTAASEPEKVQRVIRELSDADKEKMERLESQAAKDRSKAQELDKELKRAKARVETQTRVYNVLKGESELIKDKFKALEKRLNRTLLEKDLVLRALKDLEKKSGVAAERTELTAEEVAASDREVEAQQRQSAEAEATARAAAESAAAPEAGPAQATGAQPS